MDTDEKNDLVEISVVSERIVSEALRPKRTTKPETLDLVVARQIRARRKSGVKHNRKRKARRKELNLCMTCGKDKPALNEHNLPYLKKNCPKCLADARERMKAKRESGG